MTDATRSLHHLTGADALTFLQGLVTNDVLPLQKGPGIVWCALLTPQGKYLSDFFVVNTGAGLLLDLPATLAQPTLRRLLMYRLRADVQITPADLAFARGLGPVPAGAFADPRHPDLGWRAYGPAAEGLAPAPVDWDALRVRLGVPEAGVELVPEDSYILESGFEALNGVNFRKGCYVGQEVTARMKHKTELRKGLVVVRVTGSAPVGTPILAGGREVGRLFTQAQGRGLAHLRLDAAEGEMTAGEARVERI
jgi:hypothetical protein